MLPSPPLRRLIGTAPVRAGVMMVARLWKPNSLLSRLTGYALIEVHSTRLLARHSWVPPRLRRSVGLTGIARFASHLFVPDRAEHRQGQRGVAGRQGAGPVFIDRRLALADIETSIPPGRPLVYVGDDPTFPQQTDARYPTESLEDNTALVARLRDRGAAEVLVENLDTEGIGASSIPGGILPTMAMGSVRLVRTRALGRSSGPRPLRVLSAARVRDGAQWETRRRVAELARHEWSGFCDHLDREVDVRAFRRLLSTYAFILCPQGGGLDPSPKAWEALLAGCIPIVERSPTSEGYAHLPVLFVDRWKPEALSEDRLRDASLDLQAQLDDRLTLLDKLSVQYVVRQMR
jgi:hypothetical protein